MLKTALLHIGTRKTGSTSIQEALANSRDRFAAVRYPVIGRDRDHNRLLTLYFPHDQLPVHWQHVSPEATRRYRRLLFEELAAVKSAIFSAEALSSYFTPAAAQQLRADLEYAGFQRFHVILYVRDPADYFLSAMQQTLKSTSDAAPMGYNPASFRYEFRRMSETWEDAFPGSLVVRKFLGGSKMDVVQDFSALTQEFLGISVNARPAMMNTTISAESMQILQNYRLAFWPDNGGVATPDTTRLISFLEGAAGDIAQTKPVLKRALAEHIRANHVEDAAFIRSRYGVDLLLTDSRPAPSLHVDQPYRVGDLLERVDPEVVHQLLLRLAKTELERRPPTRSIPHRVASRTYRGLRNWTASKRRRFSR